jgi:hypothetical protein
MKKALCSILPILAIALVIAMVSGAAFAQSQSENDDTTLSVNYFSNNTTSGAPSGTLRITNFGEASGADLCALIYVYSADQEIQSCCGCRVTPFGLQTISVATNLLANNLSKIVPNAGTINIISSLPGGSNPFAGQAHNDPACDPTGPVPTPALTAWVTHIQNKVGSAFPITETQSYDVDTDGAEVAELSVACGVAVHGNGSGFGVCDCGPFEAGGSQKVAPK